MSTEEMFNMSAFSSPGPYLPLAYDDRPPDTGLVRRLVAGLLNWLLGQKYEWRTWQSHGTLVVQRESHPKVTVSFDGLVDHIMSTRSLDADALGLPSPNRNWLDASVSISQPAHAPSTTQKRHLTIQLPTGAGLIAEAIPELDREGVAFSNVLLTLHTRILRIRNRLVEHSPLLFELAGSWHEDLASYLNTAVSLFDATISRIYHYARHRAPTMGWQLDLGRYPSARTVPRDKAVFSWLGSLAKLPVSDRHGDYPSFDRLREVRHHLHHFDPPIFAMTIEDAADWLNLSRRVASMLLTIREALSLPPCLPLIQLAAARTVLAIPRDPSLPRYPQPPHSGYGSCQKERKLQTP